MKLAVRCLVLIAAFSMSACDREPSFETMSGETFQLSKYEGQWLVVNYWAIWCAPCRREIPELNELDHLRDDLTVVGINWDQDPLDKTSDYATRMGIEFEVVLTDFPYLMGHPRPNILPTTLIISPTGEIVNELVGEQTIESILNAVDNAQ
jgi:thiol-disulfide isomerase/thioredoxin